MTSFDFSSRIRRQACGDCGGDVKIIASNEKGLCSTYPQHIWMFLLGLLWFTMLKV